MDGPTNGPTTRLLGLLETAKNLEEQKLDGVGPLITDPPPTSSTTFPKKRKKKCDRWEVTPDT